MTSIKELEDERINIILDYVLWYYRNTNPKPKLAQIMENLAEKYPESFPADRMPLKSN